MYPNTVSICKYLTGYGEISYLELAGLTVLLVGRDGEDGGGECDGTDEAARIPRGGGACRAGHGGTSQGAEVDEDVDLDGRGPLRSARRMQ